MKKIQKPWEAQYISSFRNSGYGDNSLGIMAITLKFRLDGFDEIARESITDGRNDKGIDIVFVDRDLRVAVLAQCYYSDKRESAPVNKAATLNQANAWIFDDEKRDSLPADLRRQITELRSALDDGDIDEVYLWYVHNLTETQNAEDELLVAANSLSRSISSRYPNIHVDIVHEEVGQERMGNYYDQVSRPVLVTDSISFALDSGYYEITTEGWKSLATQISGHELKEIFQKYKNDLFSANLRGYLGSKKTDSNINNGIKDTVRSNPQNFFIFNNGVTALVNDYIVTKGDSGGAILEIKGMSIVNGAQTTGALSSVPELAQDSNVLVGIRFIKADDLNTIDDVVRFNNSQNKIEAADFRSNDLIQRRLVQEFKSISGVEYDGGRRGGAEDVMRRRKALPSGPVAQSLAAFHGLAHEAARGFTHLWNDENTYRRVFNESVTAPHVLFCYSLVRCIQAFRAELSRKSSDKDDPILEKEKVALDFLSIKGSQYLLAQAISESFEEVVGKKIGNSYRLQFNPVEGEAESIDHWSDLVRPLLKSPQRLYDVVSGQKRITSDTVGKAKIVVSELISMMSEAGILDDFKSRVALV